MEVMKLYNVLPKISLRAARVNAGLSQQEAAKKLSINKATLHSYETGKTVPSWDMVKLIEEVYQYPTDQIFFGQTSR